MDKLKELLSDLYETDEEKLVWMNSPNPLLNNETPFKLIQTEEGYQRCVSMLQAICDGAYL